MVSVRESTMTDTLTRAWAALHTVLDPEVPAVSVCDLGIVRHVEELSPTQLRVTLTPTYSGCPATEVIEAAVRDALCEAGFSHVEICLQRAPAWTTDWISAAGRDKLRRYGIAPPAACASPPLSTPANVSIHPMVWQPRVRLEAVACPRCDSAQTERLSTFGSTACKALYRCLACREPFEYFKPF